MRNGSVSITSPQACMHPSRSANLSARLGPAIHIDLRRLIMDRVEWVISDHLNNNNTPFKKESNALGNRRIRQIANAPFKMSSSSYCMSNPAFSCPLTTDRPAATSAMLRNI